MSFSFEPGVKFINDKRCYCFFHAVQQAMQGVRIKSEIYDADDEYEYPHVCKVCLDEERIVVGDSSGDNEDNKCTD